MFLANGDRARSLGRLKRRASSRVGRAGVRIILVSDQIKELMFSKALKKQLPNNAFFITQHLKTRWPDGHCQTK